MTTWLSLARIALAILALVFVWLASWYQDGRSPPMALLLVVAAAMGAGLAVLHG